MQDSQLFAFGSNGSGQLGIGHNEDISCPTAVLREDGIPVSEAKRIVCGGNHTVFCFSDGRIASTGENEDGRCFTTTEKAVNRLALRQVCTGSLLAATWSATFAVTSTGAILVSGSGSSGELGLGKGTTVASEPQLIKDFPPPGITIMRLAACMAHVVAVLSNGEVWGWGKGRKGQLGSADGNVWTPTRIVEVDFFATDAVCGKDFTCVFGSPSTGEVAVLGPNSNDRFGIKAHAPTAMTGWKQVAASWGSIYVLMQGGDIIAWGRNDHGQLPPPHLPPLRAMAAGSEHCVGLTESGQILAWGWGEHGNCGEPTGPNGDVKGRWNEIRIPHPISAIFAGCATTFIVVDRQKKVG